MLLVIEEVLSKNEVQQYRRHLEKAPWEDGQKTAGSLSSKVKNNLQLDDQSDIAISLGNHILQTLGQHPLFTSAALPNKIHPPKFNCYQGGGHYGAHVDSAIMYIPGSNITLRSDLSATLFLSDPDEYEGGELTIEDQFGAQKVKLAAGDMVLYPSSSLHHVTPVTKGARISSFFWIQSMIKDEAERTLLFDLDQSIQELSAQNPNSQEILRLTGVYHNLLRRWSDI
ncbi:MULTISPECIES: Fe2+-dependent dioxygenase [Thiomicrorhabdus]|uniref:Fe2+-dependent dioxygenase n=1 Tax=Thiomicrorhabdus heinhorstiae TaxID=2748010 RepID=A0ABS0BW63_9GAMM|nr:MULTISPECIES: Fe2+-dependent dioxygenase [Thiomicrorhabdus]MBF6058062.1 Fe2+-dependent dioxygenase [Thiomicrorhabdus heinhorstiae]